MSFGFRMAVVAAILLVAGGIFALTVRRTSEPKKQDKPESDAPDGKSAPSNVLPFTRPTSRNK